MKIAILNKIRWKKWFLSDKPKKEVIEMKKLILVLAVIAVFLSSTFAIAGPDNYPSYGDKAKIEEDDPLLEWL